MFFHSNFFAIAWYVPNERIFTPNNEYELYFYLHIYIRKSSLQYMQIIRVKEVSYLSLPIFHTNRNGGKTTLIKWHWKNKKKKKIDNQTNSYAILD